MLYKFLKQNENEMEYYLSHPDRNVRLILTQTFNRNRQKSQITKGPKTMCDLHYLGR
jgi:hypothetical protein